LSFYEKLNRGGIPYNEDDAEVKLCIEAAVNPTRHLYYSKYKVENGKLTRNPEGDMPIGVLSSI
jgi:hypothetical protein